ncbi:MAG TPA: FAD:protein FMN transferase [Candidatus Saccharimonadia bacterium]|jgi:thiamine biosynthesis lipoprotein|nr:FAD:protein FMN transferase [Candidatus Saccharimonadia bacterium]
MKKTKLIMGMPITIEIVEGATNEIIDNIFKYFNKIDERFSTYKQNSEISKINKGLPKSKWSKDMKSILGLCQETKATTNGYFDIYHDGKLDPSGLVKGWAIYNASKLLQKKRVKNFYIEAGGDIQVDGTDAKKKPWAIGIRNPFNIDEIIKVVQLKNKGMATSGTYIRGQHIYNPHSKGQDITDVRSLTVVATNVYEADRFATAAFAMGKEGIGFIERMPGLEGYMVDEEKMATFTSGFERYVLSNA